jgi:hypothetical protein
VVIMARQDRPDPASPVGQLLDQLQSLRRGNGLMRSKVARAELLCGLSVVCSEADRLDLPVERVAHDLLVATIHGLKDARSRDLLINALALDNTPPGANLADRRRRYAHLMDESRVRDQEDTALEEVARWLLEMENPEVLFGAYTSEAVMRLPAEWDVGTLIEPAGLDEVHPREEVIWDFLEKTSVLNELGFAVATETRGIIRAVVDGVTGYTIHYTSNTGCRPVGVHLIMGGKPGRKHQPGALGTARINVNFDRPLRRSETLRLHWVLSLEPGADARPLTGMAQTSEVPTRNLTLRAQFDERRLPVAPRYYIAEPDYLPEPDGSKRPLKLQPGNFITKSWPHPERQKTCVIAWQWPEDF